MGVRVDGWVNRWVGGWVGGTYISVSVSVLGLLKEGGHQVLVVHPAQCLPAGVEVSLFEVGGWVGGWVG